MSGTKTRDIEMLKITDCCEGTLVWLAMRSNFVGDNLIFTGGCNWLLAYSSTFAITRANYQATRSCPCWWRFSFLKSGVKRSCRFALVDRLVNCNMQASSLEMPLDEHILAEKLKVILADLWQIYGCGVAGFCSAQLHFLENIYWRL